MSVFAGTYSSESVQAICSSEANQSEDCSEILGQLVRKSFVEKIGDENIRYQLHPLMRQYAASKTDGGKIRELKSKAAQFFLDYAKKSKTNFKNLDLERVNILAGMDWAAEQMRSSADARDAAQMISEFMGALDDYLNVMGYWSEYRIALNQAIEAAALLEDERSLAGWVHNLGFLAHRTGNIEEARKLYQQSLEIDQKLGDQSGISYTLHQLGILAQDTGNYDEARKYYKQSLEIDQKLGDQSGMSNSFGQLGVLAQDTGNYDEARKYYKQSLEIKQELGDQSGYALSLARVALLEEKLGNIPKAIELTQQAELIFTELGAPQYVEEIRLQKERLEGNRPISN